MQQDLNRSTQQSRRMDWVRQFDDAPDGALFDQKIIAAKLDISTAQLENWRWNGQGISFIKIGRLCKYRKSDVTAFIDQNLYRSTTQIGVDK